VKLRVWHVKLAHAVLFFLLSACLFYVLVSGALNRITLWTWGAFAILFGEVVILALFRGKCPLTILAERLGAVNGRVSDIFLPRCISDRLLPIYGTLFVMGCGSVAVRVLQHLIGGR
jgi:hypothetical protein